VALGQEIAAQAVGDLAGIDPVVLPLRRRDGPPPVIEVPDMRVESAKHLAPSHKASMLDADAQVRRWEKANMANVYVEARPKGRPEGTRVDDYVVEDHADHELHTSSTQREAIDWAKRNGHRPLVARVRHLNDKKNPDHWRSAE
jgi:hypothetical protein